MAEGQGEAAWSLPLGAEMALAAVAAPTQAGLKARRHYRGTKVVTAAARKLTTAKKERTGGASVGAKREGLGVSGASGGE